MNTRTPHPDAEIIKKLGGPSALARRLGMKSPQRVQNWLVRGIPAKVRLENRRLFKGL